MQKKYLITGSTGFVGSWITRALANAGEDISIIVRDPQRNWRLEDIKTKVNVYSADLKDRLALEKIVEKIAPNIVIHLAAHGALPGKSVKINDLLETNLYGFINLIEVVKKYDLLQFINTGSSSEYGIKESPMAESHTLEPINDYGVSKSAATLYAQKVALSENLPIVTLRLFSPYGYYDDPVRLVSYVIEKALHNEPIQLSSKENVRDFIYIDDVVNAYNAVLNAEKPLQGIYNIGSGQQHSVYDIVEQIITLSKSKSTIQWGSMPKQSRQIEPAMWQADIRKAKEQLHWEPKYTIEQGLQATIEAYRKTI